MLAQRYCEGNTFIEASNDVVNCTYIEEKQSYLLTGGLKLKGTVRM